MKIIKTWLPAITGMCCMAFGAGIMSIYGFFVEPLSHEFGVGAAVLNTGPIALLLVPAIFGALIGKLADSLPVRNIMLAGAGIGMAALVAIGQAPTLVWVAVGFVSFSLGMSMYGPVVVNGMLVKLYPGREARALALAAIGMSLAAIILPPLTGSLLANFDWRLALQILAAGLLVVLWVMILAGTPRGVVETAPSTEKLVAGAFYRIRAFWLIGLCVALGLNVMIVLTICFPPFFTGRGYSVADAGWFLAVSGLAGLVGKSCLAWQGDAVRNAVKWLAAGLLLTQVVGLLLLYVSVETWQVVVALVLLGAANGAFIPMHPYLNSRYFDAAIISQVTGAQMPLFLPLGLTGAPLAGYVFDQTGSYDVVMLALAATLVIAALLIACTPAATKVPAN
ncbi:MAG: MFS transporter [Halioglobus sp.]|nr:MFS transporter [Halioglobus sp.]